MTEKVSLVYTAALVLTSVTDIAFINEQCQYTRIGSQYVTNATKEMECLNGIHFFKL